MQAHQAIDECLADQALIIRNRGQLGRHRIANNNPAPPLHQEKSAADHRGIFAKQKHPRRFRKVRMDGVQHAVFARHVVCFRRHRPKRRTSQNIFAVIRSNQIYKVGMAIRKLLHFDAGRASGQVPMQIIRQRRAIQFFTGTNGRGIGFQSQLHQINSTSRAFR